MCNGSTENIRGMPKMQKGLKIITLHLIKLPQ